MKTLLSCFFILITYSINSQSVILTTGGNFTNNGSISFSVGQLIAVPIQNSSNSVYFGAQQPKELMALSVENNQFSSSLIYPNPTLGIVNIKLDKNLNFPYQLQIFDIAGRLIISSTLQDSESQFDISNLSKGIYLLNILKNSSSVYNVKILKK